MLYILIYNNILIMLLGCLIKIENNKIKEIKSELEQNNTLSKFLIMQFNNEINYLKG